MNIENYRLRVAVIKTDYPSYLKQESLIDALRPHLQWEMLTDDEYRALVRGNNTQGWLVLVDNESNSQSQKSIDSIDDALAWADDYARKRKAQEELKAARSAKKKASSSKAKAPKPLTAKQLRDLETLRKELGVSKS